MIQSDEKQSQLKYKPVAKRTSRITVLTGIVFAVVTLQFLSYGNTLLPAIKEKVDLESLSSEYLNVLATSNYAGMWSKEFTKAPHLAGTNYELVEWQASKYEEFGLSNVEIEDFDIFLNYPVDSSLKLIKAKTNETIYHPTLKEDELKEDPTTIGDDLVPSFHGYSASGNVTAEYIYANYGTKEDFETLAKLGVSIEGKIAVIRYGGIFRGLKVKFAQEAGAIGVLLYSEPQDDGEVTEKNGYKAYPNGPARNPSSLQRGSVQFLSQTPGDPTTPGWPSKGDNVTRVSPYKSIPKIPSLPISYKEVVPILKALNGHGESIDSWKGDLDGVSYNVGPNPKVELNLYNLQDYNITKLYNVYGEIEGINKNEVILLGNHRDAWIKGGAGDPNSGSAVTLEIIRALGELQKQGWKPYRTIKFASWDGEEYGLIGSTEYGELYSKALQEKVVAYLNLDVATSGSHLKLFGSPTLFKLLNENSVKLIHPKENVTLFDHFYKDHKFISILGSGSDYTVFLEHLGIPSIDLGFIPGDKDPIYHYHSNYDSHHWMSIYGDPGFVLHNTMAKYLGLITLDLVENKILRFGVEENSKLLSKFFESTVSKIPEEDLKAEINMNRVFQKTCHGREIFKYENNPMQDEEFEELLEILLQSNPNYFDNEDNELSGKKRRSLGEIINLVNTTINTFIATSINTELYAQQLQTELDDLESHGYSPWNPVYRWKLGRIMGRITGLNLKLKYLERYFLFYKGLKERKWFRHIVYASGRNTGYAGQVYPGLTEAIEDDNVNDIIKWLFIINASIKKANRGLKY